MTLVGKTRLTVRVAESPLIGAVGGRFLEGANQGDLDGETSRLRPRYNDEETLVEPDDADRSRPANGRAGERSRPIWRSCRCGGYLPFLRDGFACWREPWRHDGLSGANWVAVNHH
jgi:hypothetical protein